MIFQKYNQILLHVVWPTGVRPFNHLKSSSDTTWTIVCTAATSTSGPPANEKQGPMEARRQGKACFSCILLRRNRGWAAWLCRHGDVNISKGDPRHVPRAVRRSAAPQNAAVARAEGCCRAAGGYVTAAPSFQSIKMSSDRSTADLCSTAHYCPPTNVVKGRICSFKQFCLYLHARLHCMFLPAGGARHPEFWIIPHSNTTQLYKWEFFLKNIVFCLS